VVWEKSLACCWGRYELCRLLGKGTFANVYHKRHVGTRKKVLINIMDKDHLSKLGIMQ